ncbi:hypothetical protein EPN90_04385 [Patescibacteria group bacterium]|nr:MAG: hypothetical protein EPN90_04385 [Patescibacteria group bacterium]
MQTKHLTVMFTDIKNYTVKSSEKTREELLGLLEEHDRLVRPVFEKFGGTVVKTIGDAFLVTFESPTDAVLCGMEIQRILKAHNASAHPNERIEVRVAINSGEVTVKDNDVFGEPVNIAARIEGIAEVNEIYFTEAVYLAMNKAEVPSAEVGVRHLKGIPHEIKVYKVLQEPSVQPAAPSAGLKPLFTKPVSVVGTKLPRWAIAVIAIIAIFLYSQDPGIANVFFLLAVHLYFSYALSVLAADAKREHRWAAWVPLINFFYCIEIAGQPGFWYVLYLIPGVNVVAFAITWIKIAVTRGAPSWIGLLILVPGVNVFVPGYLAFLVKKR